MRTFFGLTVFGLLAVTRSAYAQSSEDRVPIAAEESAQLPFYDPGTLLTVPRPPKPAVPETSLAVGLAAGINATQLLLPASESSGALIEPNIHFAIVGNLGLELGYSNLAGQSGLLAGITVLRYMDGTRVFDAGGWRGSIVWPNLNVLARFYPEASGVTPDIVFGGQTDLVGFRVAKCLGSTVFHASARGPTIGGALVHFSSESVESEFGAILGASLEVGFVFGSEQPPTETR